MMEGLKSFQRKERAQPSPLPCLCKFTTKWVRNFWGVMSGSTNKFLTENMKRTKLFGPLFLLTIFILYSPIDGHTTDAKTVEIKLLDLELWNQDGQRVKFKSDVVNDKVVAIIPFYTTCTTAYPILVFIFTRLQDMLGDRLGRDVMLVSISVDPRTDISVRLNAFARRQKAKPGWVFLSGDLNNLAKVLTGIGVQYIVGQSLDEHQHIPITLVGEPNGEWKRFYGYPSPEVLMAQINKVLAARQKK